MKQILSLGILLLTLFSCTNDSTSDPKLVVSNDELVFNGEEVKSLFISTNPKSDCDYRITSIPSWVTIDHESGNINLNQAISELKITSNFANMKPGVYEGKLEIMSNLGNKSISLRGMIGENLLYSIPDSLNFSAFNNNLKLIFKNEGNIAN